MTRETSMDGPIVGVRTEPIDVPSSARLAAEAKRWATRGRRPAAIVEPGPGQQSVWDFPRPPALERVLDRVTVELAGQLVADTMHAVRVCETASPPTYYIPLADIATEYLRPAGGTSMCEWKGVARYHSVVIADVCAPRCAWSYAEPSPEYRALANTIGFYPGRVDRCTVGDYDVRPQPGQFYAGWITPDLVGPFKGEPGSEGW